MERRLHLLSRADRYKIAMIEDDYAFDVYYEKEPVLPHFQTYLKTGLVDIQSEEIMN